MAENISFRPASRLPVSCLLKFHMKTHCYTKAAHVPANRCHTSVWFDMAEPARGGSTMTPFTLVGNSADSPSVTLLKSRNAVGRAGTSVNRPLPFCGASLHGRYGTP